MSKRRTITTAVIIIAAAIIVGYSLFSSRLLLAGPEIVVKSPENGSTFTDPFIELHGTAKRTSFIMLNGQQLFVDEQGIFRVPLVLAPGTSIMVLNARDRFNRETELKLWYTYDGSVSPIDEEQLADVQGTSTEPVATSSTTNATTSDDTE